MNFAQRSLRQSTLALAAALTAGTGLLAPIDARAAGLDGLPLTVEYGVDFGTGWTTLASKSFNVGSGIEIANWGLNADGSYAWQIDAAADSIRLRYVGTADFMNYGSPAVIGFRFVDAAGQIADFTSVTVTNTAYVTGQAGNLIEGFNPAGDLVAGANSATVNLWKSMYHHHAMGDMGDPLRDTIALKVATAVPEPGTWALTGLGLATLVAVRRRQRA